MEGLGTSVQMNKEPAKTLEALALLFFEREGASAKGFMSMWTGKWYRVNGFRGLGLRVLMCRFPVCAYVYRLFTDLRTPNDQIFLSSTWRPMGLSNYFRLGL